MKEQTTPPKTSFPYFHQGKVRDTLQLQNNKLAIVASDRISVFDIKLPTGIPGKGIVLTQITNYWTRALGGLAPMHFIAPLDKNSDFDNWEWSELKPQAQELKGRTTIVEKLDMLPIEWIVRGNLTGSGWKDYQATGCVGGHKLPAGLKKSERLPEPILTPSTKAGQGRHDENITCDDAREMLKNLGYGDQVYNKCEEYSLSLFDAARNIADEKGLILVDTKFEFGLSYGQHIKLGDEVLTPDSSRFWDKEKFESAFEKGEEPASFDKQFVRNYVESLEKAGKYDRDAMPAPELPDDVVIKTIDKYLTCYERLAGHENKIIAALRKEYNREYR
ncbi:MAG: phosphoribosylaminoimidazolesuccinocarboxamide synthase [Rickettsiales bacterium]|jgi:phosphoribosylaminoimidazole-succinocarboxamide synthase|nr:phosphoribosylaminoimidazolesuccinocarboxamide synthase [Rickettsiales bacterium]